jgi:hypothetical protein
MIEALDILGKRYRVNFIEREEGGGDCGECLYNVCTIEVATGFQCLEQQRDTLLHEVLHAVDHEMNGLGGALRERHIRALATGLYAVLRQNPALVAFLTASDGPSSL